MGVIPSDCIVMLIFLLQLSRKWVVRHSLIQKKWLLNEYIVFCYGVWKFQEALFYDY